MANSHRRLLVFLAALLLAAGDLFGQSVARKPNIVLVLVDDYGWADSGVYGNTFHRTPNIDRLAARGMRFTDAYAAAPVCSPTRAALLTGRHPARLHLTDWLPGRPDMPAQKLSRPQIRQELPLGETTIAEALRSAGYATAHIGKWHLGGAGFEPERQGFDLNVAGDQTGSPLSYFSPFRAGGRVMPGLEEAPDGQYLPDRLTTEAERFIDQNRSRPFFLYLAHYSVHIPMKAKADVVEKYRGQGNAPGLRNPIYAAMVESVDDSVGRIVKKIEDAGLSRDTLFIFTSDNGGLSVKEGPDTPATVNGPLRDGKGYLYEGGLRVPLIVCWPGRIRAGAIDRTPVYSADLFATALAAAAVSNRTGEDGVSLLPLLTGTGSLHREALFWHYPHYSNQGGKPGAAMRAGRYKLIEFYEDNRVELYDLQNDIGEQHDLAGTMVKKAGEMRRALGAWRRGIGAQMMTPNAGYAPGVPLKRPAQENESQN
ncbi:MAG: sulfatase [Acidobacteriota bacterium]